MLAIAAGVGVVYEVRRTEQGASEAREVEAAVRNGRGVTSAMKVAVAPENLKGK